MFDFLATEGNHYFKAVAILATIVWYASDTLRMTTSFIRTAPLASDARPYNYAFRAGRFRCIGKMSGVQSSRPTS